MLSGEVDEDDRAREFPRLRVCVAPDDDVFDPVTIDIV